MNRESQRGLGVYGLRGSSKTIKELSGLGSSQLVSVRAFSTGPQG